MKNSEKLGKISLGCEIANISPFGLWVLAGGREYFLDHKRFPWFRDATVEDVLAVQSPRPGHLRWSSLDVDLHVDSLEYPERYPLIASPRSHNKGTVRTRKVRRAR